MRVTCAGIRVRVGSTIRVSLRKLCVLSRPRLLWLGRQERGGREAERVRVRVRITVRVILESSG